MEMEKATVCDRGGCTHPGTGRNLAYEFGEDRATADQARSPPCMLDFGTGGALSGGVVPMEAHRQSFQVKGT